MCKQNIEANKVAFVIPRLGKGGAERVVTNLANQMVRDGFLVRIYTILSIEEDYVLENGIEHVHIKSSSQNKILRILKRFFELRRRIKEDEAKTIIAFERYYGICASLFTGRKIIATERNDPYSNMPKISVKKYFRDLLYMLADCVVFQTKYAQNYFNAAIKKHSVVIPNPVSSDILPEPYHGKRNKQIVTACRLTTQKNLPMLIDAFEMFLQNHMDYSLVIYGEGPLKGQLEKSIEKKGLENKIKLPGHINNLPQTMNEAAMYVSSSDFEGISNSMLEALACGVPTICTDCPAGGAAMMIQNGINGYLVPVKDAKKMSLVMSKIVDDYESTQKMCRKAVEVRNSHSVKKIASMWEDVILK